MVRLYNTKDRFWHRKPVVSFIGYLRDILLQLIPFKLPGFLVKLLYGAEPDFIFLVHPRNTEDVYRGFPALSVLRRMLSKVGMANIIKRLPPIVIGSIKSQKGVTGLVVSSFYLPNILLGKNKATLKQARRCISFSSKLAKRNSYIGLGAWWPIVTRNGLALRSLAERKGMVITNGHTGTLISIVLSVRKIARLSGKGEKNLKIVIVGAGKMGSNLGKALAREVTELGLVDLVDRRLDRLENRLKEINTGLSVKKFVRTPTTDMKELLGEFDVAVCVTSNARRIINTEDLPGNLIIIDDSRPEAVSRDNMPEDVVVLEGGLIKIPGLASTYNYGFGVNDNVFGCLAETYALAADGARCLEPTMGEVDLENYYRMMEYFEKNGLECGDLKSGDRDVPELRIAGVLNGRPAAIRKENKNV